MYVQAKAQGNYYKFTCLQKRKTRTKMAAFNFGGLQETRTQALQAIG